MDQGIHNFKNFVDAMPPHHGDADVDMKPASNKRKNEDRKEQASGMLAIVQAHAQKESSDDEPSLRKPRKPCQEESLVSFEESIESMSAEEYDDSSAESQEEEQDDKSYLDDDYDSYFSNYDH